MSSTPTLPFIPEILNIICEQLFLNNLTLACLARTCRALENPALNVFWSHLNGLSKLLRCLPSHLWEEKIKPDRSRSIVLLRSLAPQDCERMMQYAKRVWQFELDSLSNTGVETAVYDVLHAFLKDAKLFPNIRALVWEGLGVDFCIPFKFFHIFLGPSLYKFDFQCCGNSAQHISMISTLGELYPSITSFAFHWPQSVNDDEPQTVKIVSEMIPKWQHLETLSVSNLTYSALPAVSTLPSLKRLQVNQFETDVSRLNVQKGGFPALRNLNVVVQTEIADFIRILEHLDSSPVESLTMYFCVDEDHTPASWKNVFAAVRDYCHHDTLLSLNVLDLLEYPKLEPEEKVYQGGKGLTYDAINPLLVFHNLLNIQIDTPRGLYLSDYSETKAMASSWTRIKILMFKLPPYCQSGKESKITVADLLPFAEYCPHLEKLGLFIDGCSAPNIHEGKLGHGLTQTALTELRVGDSHACNDAFPIAAFLSSVFPSLGCICALPDEDIEYYDSDAGGDGGPRTRSHKVWNVADQLLENLVAVRKQEMVFYTSQQ
ncbi:hypothetical protein BDQ17DRAFT_1427914 [Cyathus striatus]|nr:hypothetical protein BDQ17DRAFT_1427914 [Cyathus striatus]